MSCQGGALAGEQPGEVVVRAPELGAEIAGVKRLAVRTDAGVPLKSRCVMPRAGPRAVRATKAAP